MTNIKVKKVKNDEDEASRILYRDFTTPFRKNFIVVGADDMYIAESFEKYVETIRNFEVHNSDIFIASYPKAGTTWVSEMVWMISNKLDFKGGEVAIQKRVPFLEMCGIYDQEEMSKRLKEVPNPEFVKDSLYFIKRQPSPRFIKTHLQFSLLPQQIQTKLKTPKIVYVVRNPKDVCVSYYHHAKLLEGYRGNFEDFCTVFLAGKIQYGSFWKNVLGFWNRRSWPNILFITYEDMKKDICSVIRKVARFLEKSLTEEQVQSLKSHLSFESMKNNKAVNLETVVAMRKQLELVVEGDDFMRSGSLDEYKQKMPPEIIAKFDAWIKKNVDGTDFTLYC